MKKYILLFHLLLLSLCAIAQFSGAGPANLTTPSGASSIQWYEVTASGAAAIAGETNATYSTSTSGIFYADYIDSSQPATCQDQQTTFTFVIEDGETITLDGSNNNGGGSSYQWYNDGAPISGATSDSYAATEGGFYQLTYDNGICTTVSKPYYVFLLQAAASIDAVADDYTTSPIDPVAGGTTTSVFANDSADGVSPATDALIDDNISISNNGGLTGVTIGTDGVITVPANTTAGTYTVAYTICLAADNAICNTANVTIVVASGGVTIPVVSTGQYADPAVTGTHFAPNTINTGETSNLTVSFSNTGSTDIPVGAIELTISTANSYYTTDGTTVPAGAGGALFNWTYQGADSWRGTNNAIVPAFSGGDITLTVTGNTLSTSFEATSINVQPINNFSAFANSSANDNLQPDLFITLDTDGDGIADVDDLDDDNDGIRDGTELASAPVNGDTDGDGIPDNLDLDSDNDGINDVLESGGTDANGDGIADGVVGTTPATNGIPATANTGNTSPDTDSDGQPDFQDLDSDNDTVSDLVEGGSGAPDADNDGVADGPDADQDGIVDAADGDDVNFGDLNDPVLPNTDSDSQNTPDYIDPDSDNPAENTVGATDGTGDDIDDNGNADLDGDADGLVDNPADTDDDGIADVVDDNTAVFGGLGIPDTDGDGIVDTEDLDDDNDGITDVVELATAPANGDTDGDGIPDNLDLDADNDGINDVLESGGTDTNDDGIADGVVGTTPTSNGIPATAGTGNTPPDTDNDGQPDFQDLDSDNDTVSDLVEGGSGAPDANDDGVADGPDADQDGIVDAADGDDVNFGDMNDPTLPDTDNEGTPDYIDPDSDDATDNTVDAADGTGDDIDGTPNSGLDADADGLVDNPADSDEDGIADVVDANIPIFGGLGTLDTDGDGIPDTEDLDDDNDGITDVTELASAPTNGDTDGDGIPDNLDLDSDNDGINDVLESGGTDADGDGMADGVVGTTPTTNGIPATAGTGNTPPDTDSDGQPDFQDLDSDNDTVSDLVEGGSGAPDANDDGVADGPDADQDGIVDAADGDDVNFGDLNDPALPNTDSDSQNTPDYIDPDSDNPAENTVGATDGTGDDIDGTPNSGLDADGDGLVDNPADIDDDGIADVVDDNIPVFGGLGTLDTDGDGIPDTEDLDDDNDGITDVTELASAPANGDTDGDGIPDNLDLDSDNDGINDVLESGGTDADGDGIADGVVGTTPTTNGIPATAGTGNTPPDTDSDGQPDFQDLDSDNDTVSDLVEGGSGAPDANNDGVADGPDADMDGIVDAADGDDVNFGDMNDPILPDTDNEGTPDYIDPDSDDATDNTVDAADGTGDDIDGTPNSGLDADGDGLVDNPTDIDDDGIADVVDDNTTVFGGLGISSSNMGDVLISEISICNQQIELYNSSSATIDVSSWYLCKFPMYAEIGTDVNITTISGNMMIPAGGYLVLQWGHIGQSDGEIGLYMNNSDFGSAANIKDYIQYNSGNNGRAAVAVSAGVWDNAGSFVTIPTGSACPTAGVSNPPNGSTGTDTGSSDWCVLNTASLGSANGSCLDTDSDGIADVDDLDDDNDGITDVVELATAPANGDTDGDGIPDNLDLDADNDGINDVLESGGTDANGDGIADGVVGTTPTTNGIPATANIGNTPPDTDSDGQLDFQDLDSDNDTVSDLVEGGSGALDADDDGVADGPDADQDGIVDNADGNDVDFGDLNDHTLTDADNEGTPDYIDPDSDDPTENMVGTTNGASDDIDDTNNGSLDGNGDGQVDNPADTDNDGIADVVDNDIPVFGGLGIPNVSIACNINLSVWLEGVYDVDLNEMRTDLNDQQLLPGQDPLFFLGTETPVGQPYNTAPWSYSGTDGATYNYTTVGDGKAGYDPDVVDWVLVTLRTSQLASSAACTQAAWLMKDGTIMFPNGCSCTLAIGQSYYIVIEHRNHLPVMSPNSVTVTASGLSFDFRTQQSFKTFTGDGQQLLEANAFGMFAANGDQISSAGSRTDINATDESIWTGNNSEGDIYNIGDYNLDGDVNADDESHWLKNSGKSSDVNN